MSRTKPKTASEETEFDVLSEQYKKFIERLKRRWLRYNNRIPEYPPFGGQGLYEIDHRERNRADGVIRRWGEYVTPLAEKWWERRGYGILWPEKLSDPCKLYKLEAAAA